MIWISEVEGWRRPFHTKFEIKNIMCHVLIGSSMHAFFFYLLFYYFISSVHFLTPLSAWPSGWGGWSPNDPKFKGLTPIVCKCLFYFLFHFYFVYFHIIFYQLCFIFTPIYFIILKSFLTWTPLFLPLEFTGTLFQFIWIFFDGLMKSWIHGLMKSTLVMILVGLGLIEPSILQTH